MSLPTNGSVRSLSFHPDGVRLAVLTDGERAVRWWHLDRLRDSLKQLNLAGGLEVIARLQLPPPPRKPVPVEPLQVKPPGVHGLKTDLSLQRR